MGKILSWIKLNPAAVVGAVMALVNMAVLVGVHLTAGQSKAIGVITGAVLTIVVALATRPVGLQVIVGGATTIVGALAAFHFHPSAALVSTLTTVLSLVLSVVFHLAHTPVTAFNKGLTAEALSRRKLLAK